MNQEFLMILVKNAEEKAIARCWAESSTKPMTDFIKKFEEFFEFKYDEWLKASPNDKWLSIIKITKSSKNPNVKKYLVIAKKMEREILK